MGGSGRPNFIESERLGTALGAELIELSALDFSAVDLDNRAGLDPE